MAQIDFEANGLTAAETEIAELVRHFFVRYDLADWPWFREHFSQDFLAYHGANIYSRGPYLEALTSGDMRMTMARVYNLAVFFTPGDNLALARYQSTIGFREVESGKEMTHENLETLVYRRESDGVWRLLHAHA